jgi:DnaK suppressor protein
MQSFLSAGQRALLQQLLQLRQHELDRQVARHQGSAGRVERAHELLQQDGDDAPQRDADRDVDLAQADREMVDLGAVSEALARVHDADFGCCVDCGEPIPFDRLKIEPWALRCVACQSKREAASSHGRPGPGLRAKL